MKSSEPSPIAYLQSQVDTHNLIGRVFMVDERGRLRTAGVITNAYIENGNSLVIVIRLLRRLHFINGVATWKATHSTNQYKCTLGWVTTQKESDGTIRISATHSWSGEILPAGAELPAVTS